MRSCVHRIYFKQISPPTENQIWENYQFYNKAEEEFGAMDLFDGGEDEEEGEEEEEE